MGLVFGMGVGLFILIILWSLAFLLCIALSRDEKLKAVAFGFSGAVALLTVILILYPREGDVPVPKEVKIYDGTFWGRLAIVTIFAIFSLLSVVFLFVFHWTQPVYAKPLKTKKY